MISAAFEARFVKWATRRQSVAERVITFHRRRIYILPTRFGYLFALTLLLMLLGSVNYNNSLAFVLTFLLAGLGANAMWFTHRNLLNLRVNKAHAAPVFAGQNLLFKLPVDNDSALPRRALSLHRNKQELELFDVEPSGITTVTLPVPTESRGRLRPGRFAIQTRYPLGLFEAWSWLEFDMSGLIYPRPVTVRPRETFAAGDRRDKGKPQDFANDDYAGFRDYHAGDSPNHIAWKQWARSNELLTKQFHNEAGQEVWFDWDQTSGDVERRLSVLSGWIVNANLTGLTYGLRIPGAEIAPANDEAHKHACLEELALFDAVVLHPADIDGIQHSANAPMQGAVRREW
ncbi:MAG: DUF58 domain-containing protein [Gammaproteobacteria bacterium]